MNEAAGEGAFVTLQRRLSALASNDSLRRFVAAMAPTAVALALQFLAFVVTARGLGVEQLGQYAALLGLAAMGVELVSVGTADVMVRAVARDRSRFPEYYGHMLIVIGVALLPVTALLSWSAVVLVESPVSVSLVFACLFAEILTARIAFSVEMAMVAHQEPVAASAVRFGTSFARLATALIYFSFRSDLEGWILATLAQGFVVAGCALAAAAVRYGKPVWRLQTQDLVLGLVFGTNQVALTSQSNLDRVVLGRYAGGAAVGVYAAGSRVLQVGLFPIQIVTRILYPRFFKEGEGGIVATRRLALKSLPAMFATGVASAAAVMAVAWFLPSILGGEFARSRDAAIQLAFVLPIIATQYLAADALTGAGYQSLRAALYVVAAVSFSLALALGARLGETQGVIVAFLGAHLLLAVILWAAAFLVRPRAEVRS